jgi:hypothetical protein
MYGAICCARRYFFVLSRSKIPRQSIGLLSCRVGCEFITITISIARREAAENFCPSAASIGSQHTMAELVQCSLINCWSHVQNVTRGPWPSMQAKGDGRRKRPWSDLPAPNAVIRKKSALAALTPKANGSTKLQAAVSSAYRFARAPKAWRVNIPGSTIRIALSPSVSSCSSVLVIAGQRVACAPDDNLCEAIRRGIGKADLLPRYARRIDGEVLASARANGK